MITQHLNQTQTLSSDDSKLRQHLLRQHHVSRIYPLQKVQLRWLEQLDVDTLLTDNVDLANSQSALTVPLVDLAVAPGLHISLSMSYTSGDYKTNGLLGNGWNLHHAAQDFIAVDHKQSTFTHNHKYQLSIQGQVVNLERSKENPNRFEIKDHPEISISFESVENRWIIETPNMRTVYGASDNLENVPNALHYSLHWPNWRGPGKSEAGLEPEVVAWYMISREEKHGLKRKIYYRYNFETRTTEVENKPFTSEVLLESVYDLENRFLLNLFYDTKERNEYAEKSLRNAQGIIQFPVHLVAKHYLLGYHLETENYQQQLQFNYDTTSDGQRMLTGVVQVFNEVSRKAGKEEQIFNFGYTEAAQKTRLLTQLEIPTYHTNLQYSYTQLQIPLLKFAEEKLNIARYPAVGNVQVSQGTDFAIMAYDLGTGGIYIRVLNREMTKFETELYTTGSTSKAEDDDDPKKIKRFAAIVYPNLIAVLEETGEEKRLHFFNRPKESNQWPRAPSKSITLKLEALFRYTDEFMVIAKNEAGKLGQVTLLVPDSEETEDKDDDQESMKTEHGFTETILNLSNGANFNVTRLVTQDGVILAYNGHRLHGWKQNKETEQWTETVIHEMQSEEAAFMNRFEVSTDNRKFITDQLNVAGLHIADNQILLVGLKWVDGANAEVITNAHLLLVDNQLRKVHEEVHVAKRENVMEMQKEEKEIMEGTTFWFRYKENTDVGKFQTYLHDIAGRDLDEKCKDYDDKPKCKEEVLKMYNDDPGFRDNIKDLILFDAESMITFRLEPTGATAKNGKFEMTGTGWTSGNLPEASLLKLGNGFALETKERRNDSETDYALYRQNLETGGKFGEVLGSWTLHSENSGMALGYPSYLGMQSDLLDQPALLPFRDQDTEMKPIMLGEQGEVLMRMSNQEMVLSLINSTDASQPAFDKQLIVRRVNSVIPSTPLWALSKTEVSHENLVRVRTYENRFNCSVEKAAQENVVRVMLADTPEVSGYYEEITVVPLEAPQNSTKAQNWYDARGELVRTKDVDTTIREKAKEKEGDEQNRKWRKIWDTSEQLEISDISPYNKTDQAVAYYGFESYENNTIGLEFPQNGVSEDFSFTGQNLLRLNTGEKISGFMTPLNQQATYVVSTWLRYPPTSAPEFEFERPATDIRANLITHTGQQFLGVYGQLKRLFRDWFYVEVILDLDKIRNNVYTEFYRHSDSRSNLPPPSTTNFTIKFEVGPETSTHLDMDHIRFAPINLDFTVNVFDARTGQETAQILSDGGVIRKVYNDYGTDICGVDESGQIEQLKSLSRSGFIFPPPETDSDLGMQEIRREVIFIPEHGQLEIFDQFSRQQMWSIEDYQNPESWSLGWSRLTHLSTDEHSVTAKLPGDLFDPTSSAVRFMVHFSSAAARLSVSLSGYPNLLKFSANGTLEFASGCQSISNLPTAAELILAITDNTLWVWVNGVLVYDRELDETCLKSIANLRASPWSQFSIEMTDQLTISNFITLAKPQISVEHFNAWGERTQTVILEDSNTALVSETIYDEMGRDAIKTKSTRISRTEKSNPLLVYYPNFVQNRYPSDPNSVFKIGTISGLASELNTEDEGYPYSRTLYQDDMLREVKVEGLPGKAFSTFGTFNKQHNRSSGLDFLQILFPHSHGFREKVTYEPNGNINVSVLDSKQNEVAIYVKVLGFDNILTIYEHDEEGKLLKMLPPKYHQKMRTFLRTKPWNFGDDQLTEEEKYWQGKYGTHYRYNEMKQLVQKMAPDHKTKGFLYDPMGNMRFMYTLATGNETLKREDQMADEIVYMLHSGQNKLVEIGYFQDALNVGMLENYQNGTVVPSEGSPQIHQRVVYSDTHADPEVRGKVRLFLTYDDHHDIDPTRSGGQSPPHQELLKFNNANQVVMKTSNALYTGSFSNYQKHYKGGKMREMAYPRTNFGLLAANETTFNLMHNYDKLGRVTQLGTRLEPNAFAKITYNAGGQVQQELVDPTGILRNSGTRNYRYNAPGLLTQIQDHNLAQNISYIDGGYGQYGHGDGILMNSLMSASWAQIQNLQENQQNWFRIPQEDFAGDKTFDMCINALKRVGIVDADTNIPVKQLTRDLLNLLPLTCDGALGYELMKLVAKYLPPTNNYGHAFSYGSQRELVKAKFAADNGDSETLGPLKIQSFMDAISEIDSPEKAEQIWDLLKQHQFIIVENGNPDDKTAAIGKQGTKSIFGYSQISTDLREIGQEDMFAVPIVKLIYNHVISNLEMFSLGEFQDIFVNWHGYEDTSTPTIIKNMARQAAAKIYAMLEEKDYLIGNLQKIMNPEFVEAMQEFPPSIYKIANVLTTHFAQQIGTSTFDYESYSIDPNGNHGMFYAGLQRHELEYDGESNQVKRLKVRIPFANPGEDEVISEFTHDSQGNVNMAEHKGIKLIKYHPATNRPMLIELFDGRRILFKYDGQGERLLKRVFGSGNKLISETKYLRDENGRVLMDKLTKFGENQEILKEIETTYLYGPRGVILGFIRNGKFYGVFTDHAGSTRLITQGGKVVAGYDYWPYGEFIRKFGNDDDQLMYRFTGQEYDEEMGLYNYHARLYDPTIGRFFQPDPKSQYYSPYVYGGNSPVSMVDPDGEFFWFIVAVVVGALVGGYLAGAQANGTWNPFKWDWTSKKTWLSILAGGVGGALLPGAFATAAAAIGTIPAIIAGVVGSYVKAAQQNGSWNPFEWDWTNPATYNAFLEGFSSGLSKGQDAFANIKGFIQSFSKTGQKLLLESASGAVFGLITGAVANDKNFKFWEWDWSDPETLSAIKDGFFTGKGFPEQATKAYRGFADMVKNGNLQEMLKDMKGTTKTFIKDVFKNPEHPLWKNMGKAVISYVAYGKEMGTLDLTKWDWHSLSTYESLLNNFKIGSELKSMVDTFRKRDWLEAGIDFGLRELQRHIEAHPAVEKIFDGLDDVWKFYNLPRLPFKKKQNYLERFFTMSLATKMFWNAQQKQNGVIQEEIEFDKEMNQILDGIRSGATIYPLLSEELSQLIDCEIPVNGTLANFAKCSIGSGSGKTARQNREWGQKMFVASKLYQSKNEFVPVRATREPEELPEFILETFGLKTENRMEFYESFVLGSVYRLLLSTEKNSAHDMFFSSEHLQEMDLTLTHIALLKDEELIVRTLVATSQSRFSEIQEPLAEHLKQMKFQCYLPAPYVANKVKGEILVIVSGLNKSDVYIITPDYVLDGGEECAPQPKFAPVPKISSNIFPLFESFLEDGISIEEKAQRYHRLAEELSGVYFQLASELLPNSLFAAFAFGLLTANLKSTYDLSIDISRLDTILFVPQRNSGGVSTWYGTPAFIANTDTSVNQLGSLLHKSTLLSLSKLALIARLSGDNSVSVETETLPNLTGFGNLISSNYTEASVYQAVKYVYHNHHVLKPSFSFDQSDESFRNVHFLSNMVLGELLSRMETNPLETFVYAPDNSKPSSKALRLLSQRIFIFRNPATSDVTVLNIIESSKQNGDQFEFDPTVDMDIPMLPEVDINQLDMILVKANPNSKVGFNLDETNFEGATHEQVFLQDIQISSVDHGQISRDNDAFIKLNFPSDNPNLSKLSFSKNYITELFGKLKENRLRLLVTSDTDLSSLLVGVLMGPSIQMSPDLDGVNVLLRKFVSSSNSNEELPASLSLLSLTKDGVVVPQTEQIFVASLKTFGEGGTENTIREKINNATEELMDYHCSRESRLAEAFKVTSVPAVYDFGETPVSNTGNRMWYNIDPVEISELNCSAEANPFEKYMNDGKSEESSGTFDFIRNRLFSYFASGSGSSRPKAQSSNVKAEGCHLGAWVNGEGYSVDGITCTSGKSSVAVFRNVQKSDIVAASGRGQPQYEPRLFDELDGNLMLGRVVMHLGGKLWKFVRKGGRYEPKVNHFVPEKMVGEWKTNLAKVKETLATWKGSEEDISWVVTGTHECQELIEQIKMSGYEAEPELIEELTERLEAMQEDLAEQILFDSVKDNLHDHKSNVDNKEERFETEAWKNNWFHGMQQGTGQHVQHAGPIGISHLKAE